MKLKKNVPMKPWLDWELGFQALTDEQKIGKLNYASHIVCLLYTSPSPRDNR